MHPRSDYVFPVEGVWVPRAPTKMASLPRKQLGVRYLPLTSFKEGVGSFPIGASCVNVMKRRFTIFSCTSLLLGLYGISFSLFPQSIKEALINWRRLFKGKDKRKTWRSVPLCIFWTIWKERNHVVFREGSIEVQRLKNFFVYNLWSWNRFYLGEETLTLLGFLEWLASN